MQTIYYLRYRSKNLDNIRMIRLDKGEIKMEYQLIYSNRTTLAIQTTEEGTVLVKAPKKYSRRRIRQFVRFKEGWITRKTEQKKAEAWYINAQPFTRKERSYYYEAAAELFEEKSSYYAEIMGVTYNRITIMEKRSKWGSCSKKGELQFNWRLLLAPEPVQDYVVILELAQLLKGMYSTREVLESMMPEYEYQEYWLKANGIILWSRA